MNMTRNQYMELMGLKTNDKEMVLADNLNERGHSWWEIVKADIMTMKMSLSQCKS